MKKNYQRRYLFPFLFLLGLVILSAYLFYSLYEYQREFLSAQDNRYHSYLLATQLRRSSDELTRLVRTYAATNNPMYEKQYWEVLAIRNGQSPLPRHYDRVYWDFLAVETGTPPYALGEPVALKKLMKIVGITQEEFALLEKSQAHSDRLVNLEIIAMNAMKGRYQDGDGKFSIFGPPNRQMAIDLLYGDEYHQAKIAIMSPINQFYEKLDERTEKQVVCSAKRLEFVLNFKVVVFVLILSIIVLLIYDARRHHRDIVESLNQKVNERTEKLNKLNLELQQALDEIKTLRGVIPICAYCHNIRNDEGAWDQMESYISEHTDAVFSHGICPKCMANIRSK